MWSRRRSTKKPQVSREDFAWEIRYDKAKKPVYFNKETRSFDSWRPTCLEEGGRLSIKQPYIQAKYKRYWYKGTLLGPDDEDTFIVQLDDAPVRVLTLFRDDIREWRSDRRYIFPSSRPVIGNRENSLKTSDPEPKRRSYYSDSNYASETETEDEKVPTAKTARNNRWKERDEKSDDGSIIFCESPRSRSPPLKDYFKSDRGVRNDSVSYEWSDEDTKSDDTIIMYSPRSESLDDINYRVRDRYDTKAEARGDRPWVEKYRTLR